MKHKLLIVEDDPDTSEMLRVYFEAQGYTIAQAYTGQEALKQSQSNPPDLILLDVRLPDIDGFEVGQKLQEDLQTSRLPIIFVTERQERDYRIAGLKLGAIDYVTKPFDIQELRLRVRNALHRVGGQNNPITGLPGDKLIAQRLETTLKQENWAAISITLSGLSLFNEIYGFVARDDVLRAIALILTSVVDEAGTIDDFVGHPTENQFVITTTAAKVNILARRIETRMAQAMTYFYPIHDRETGYVFHGNDEKIDVPFMDISIISLSNQNTHITNVEQLGRALSISL